VPLSAALRVCARPGSSIASREAAKTRRRKQTTLIIADDENQTNQNSRKGEEARRINPNPPDKMNAEGRKENSRAKNPHILSILSILSKQPERSVHSSGTNGQAEDRMNRIYRMDSAFGRQVQ
jgi:hypothetical protein